MTYKELYLKEHPGCDIDEVIRVWCPGVIRLDSKHENLITPECIHGENISVDCPVCWDKEIPEETKGFKAEELVPVGEEVAKGIEKGILEPKTSVNFDSSEFQKKVYEALGIPEFKPLTGEEIREYANELYEEFLKKHGDKFKDAAEVRMKRDKENLKEMIESDAKGIFEHEAHNIELKPLEAKSEFDIGGIKVQATETGMAIKDSGTRREFATGAVRDIQEGKGRCDLMPLDVVADVLGDNVLSDIDEFQQTGDYKWLQRILCITAQQEVYRNEYTMLLEVAKHFEAGAAKYGEWNWQKGIPTHCYIDSAVRHYLKFLRGDKDEPHDRAFVWNILCCIWTCVHKPELNDYPRKEEKTDE